MLNEPRKPQPPSIVIEASEASELLMMLKTVTQPADSEGLEVGRAWLEATERRAGVQLLSDVRNFAEGRWYIWIKLLHFTANSCSSDGISVFLDRLQSTDAEELVRHLCGYHDPDVQREVGPNDIASALAGGAAAQRSVLCRSVPFPRWMVTTPPSVTKDWLLEVLSAWAEVVWETTGRIAMPILGRDALDKTGMIGRVAFQDLVMEMTSGVYWPYLPDDVRLIRLIPSYVNRPWVAHTEAASVLTVVYPVSDASLGSASEFSTRRLARLSAAHRATHRAEVLRMLAHGVQTLQEMSAALDVSATELLPTLVSLRAGGLIAVDGRTHRYELHQSDISDFGQLLVVSADLFDLPSMPTDSSGLALVSRPA